MWNKKRWIFVSLICVGLGAVLLCVGRLMGGAPSGIYIDKRGVHAAGSLPERSELKDEVKLEAFDSMELDVRYADVKLEESDRYAVEYCVMGGYGAPVCEVRDGKLVFKEAEPLRTFRMGYFGIAINTPSYYVRVEVPKNAKLSEVLVYVDNGKLTVDSLQSDSLKISSEYGDTILGKYDGNALTIDMDSGNLSADVLHAGRINVTNDYGDVDIEEARGESLTVKLDSGQLEIGRMEISDVKIENEYGDADVEEARGKSLTVQMDSGDFRIGNMAFADVKIEDEYGSVNLGLSGDIGKYGFDLKTEYGSISMPDEGRGWGSGSGGIMTYRAEGDGEKKVMITCDCGDIEINAVKE